MSSIDFLLTKLDEVIDGKTLLHLLNSGIVDEARMIHKQEIKEATLFGGTGDEQVWDTFAEQYYNETFGEINLLKPPQDQ